MAGSNILKNKINFLAVVSVTNANPNGDPMGGNRPRTTSNDYGEISDICIKRKIRNRLQDAGECIFVQSEDRADDGMKSLQERYNATMKDIEKEIKEEIENGIREDIKKNTREYKEVCLSKMCEKWIDVRSFGQVFAFDDNVHVRGPVSVQCAYSCSPVVTRTLKITKSVNGTDSKNKSSDTMGNKHFIEFGVYLIKGSINVQLAEKTGFTEEDAEKIKEALRTLFVNDSSSARPDGSMEVVKVFWWKHNNKIGQYSSAEVFRTVKVALKDGVLTPSSISDYEITRSELDGLEAKEIKGL